MFQRRGHSTEGRWGLKEASSAGASGMGQSHWGEPVPQIICILLIAVLREFLFTYSDTFNIIRDYSLRENYDLYTEEENNTAVSYRDKVYFVIELCF